MKLFKDVPVGTMFIFHGVVCAKVDDREAVSVQTMAAIKVRDTDMVEVA